MFEKHLTRPASDRRIDEEEELAALEAMSDAEVERRTNADPDAPPLYDADWWAGAAVVTPRKVPVSLRLDPDILAYFKAEGPGYQTRINAVLRTYVEAMRRGSGTAGD